MADQARFAFVMAMTVGAALFAGVGRAEPAPVDIWLVGERSPLSPFPR